MLAKLGIIQTKSYASNHEGIKTVSKMLESLAKKEADIVCLPEQWLPDNRISDFNQEFGNFKSIAKNYSMTIIPGAFYERKKYRFVISAPVIGPTGEIIGRQEKIHPFEYEKNLVRSGTLANVFKTKCKFGIVICYDMVFSDVSHVLVKKGAQVLFSPSRIVRRGLSPWHLYNQVRALENRVPVLAANVQNHRFGGASTAIDLCEKHGVILPKILAKLTGQNSFAWRFNLEKNQKSRKKRFADARKFT